MLLVKTSRQSRGRAGCRASLEAASAALGFPAFVRFHGQSMNSLRALRPLRSDSIDKSEHEARKRAAKKSNKRRRLETDLRQPAQPRLCSDAVTRDR
jgi:hypothetical protein